MLYVYVTDQCYEDTHRISKLEHIEKLKDKLIREQSTSGLQRHPHPFLKKRIGRTRINIAEVQDGEDVVLCFLRHVYKYEIGNDYENFFSKIRVPQTEDADFVTFLEEARTKPIEAKQQPSELELEYLLLDRNHEMGDFVILESPIWIQAIKWMRETQGKQGLLTPVWEVLEKICEDTSENGHTRCEYRHDRYDLRVLYRYFPDNNCLFLIAPLEDKSAVYGLNSIVEAAKKLSKESSQFNETDLLRNASRAYPDFIIYDREIWESTQASIDANLALSPEESDILSHVLDPRQSGGFPLFINGRPGSGKSTILQYLFAEYLHAHLARSPDKRLARPPLYLTYNERLLENARKLVEDIFHCGAEKLALTEAVDLHAPDMRAEFDSAFVYFRKFLLSLLDGGNFNQAKYIDFHRFRSMYILRLQGPDSKLRRLAPEVAWHTLRTYIKGKSTGESEYFDPDDYAELPRDEITVAPETYELVWDKVWNGWYRDICEKEGHWDDQDLARKALDQDLVPSEYPGVFCDEAQDFTTVELELIFRLSCFATKRIEPYYLTRIPYAFAGDPFQTLNPTGFRWDSIKANFHDNIVHQLDPDQRGKVELTFKELAYNYRSTSSIVRFCNLVQLKRAELFDIPDVTPQKAWTIDKGTPPAYFEVDLGTIGKLKDQSELVIVVPCQEGEEKAFVENDQHLRTIALDEKGEIARSVLSPMRAKGLEFGRVVLYKFGEQAIHDGHVNVISKIKEKNGSPPPREETLSLEYFFNGTYVGASRSQRRLLIVDTREGLEHFWNFATNASEIGELLTEKRRSLWSEDDIHHMMRGDPSTWAEERDDPKSLAERFFNQGLLERSTYLLQLARNLYDALDDKEKTERCTALIHDIDGEFTAAADSYERLGELKEAIRCHWEAKSYNKVSEIAVLDPGRLANSPFVLASRFLNNNKEPENANKFLRALDKIDSEQIKAHFKFSHWAEVLQQTVEVLANDATTTSLNDSGASKEALRILMRLEKDCGFTLNHSTELALLAFNAGDHVVALDIWNDVSRRTTAREPNFILRARALTTSYPHSLRWYDLLEDHDAVVLEYQSNPSRELEEDQQTIILEALLTHEEYGLAVDLLKDYGSWHAMRQLFKALPNTKAGKYSACTLLGPYLRVSVGRKKFRCVIEDIRQEKTEVKVLSALLADERMLLSAEAGLIKLLARDRGLVEQSADDKFISGRLRTISKKRASKLKDLVTLEEVGAALERIGRMDNALAFYESVFKSKIWGASRGTELNAKERWLKCKERQANLSHKDQKRKNQRLSEANHRSADWGLPIPDEEYPSLPKLKSDEIDSLFVEQPTSAQLVIPTESEKDEKKKRTKLVHESKGVVPVKMPTEAKPEKKLEKQDVSETPSGSSAPQLPTRTPFNGKIQITCKCTSVDFEIMLLPSKRRLEVRDKETSDLLMIYAKDTSVESRDIEVANSGVNTWHIESWSLNIQLIAQENDIALVDISDDDGRRVLCLLA
ncbi:hypothetical protein [endosymbiont of Lamellibrachia barhami]|uniref:hypothetical protein n=1 Tax=endosymbiont of Lamellibrachia barhami TaxID=205975 RepID=UPI0015AE19B1|nr:hypothetical protein [endosymbiont of Lamellibrachia barhami]